MNKLVKQLLYKPTIVCLLIAMTVCLPESVLAAQTFTIKKYIATQHQPHEDSYYQQVLQQLNIQPGNIVLEVGTGSGYSTKLLAKKAKHVTTIEIDPATAKKNRSDFTSTRN